MNTKENNYRAKVLKVNTDLKKHFRSVNGAVKFIIALQPEGLTKDDITWLKGQVKDNYSAFSKKVRHTKKGTTPFFVLQALYRERYKK